MRKDAPAVSGALCSAQPSVGQMFDRIAPTYDLLNHLLSLGRDSSWRRKLARRLEGREVLRVADLATGTGDLLIALLQEHAGIAEAAGLDISENMLEICREKLRRCGLAERVKLTLADASATQLPEGTFDAVTMAFGIRNTTDALETLREMRRILKPSGVALVLEFSLPRRPVLRWCYRKYLRFIVPFIGALVSGDGHAYRYLNSSIEHFCREKDLSSLLCEAGFCEASVVPLTFGVASIYRGVKGPISG